MTDQKLTGPGVGPVPASLVPGLPTYVQFEPVGICNLRCQMCPLQFRTYGASPGSKRALASWELFERVIAEVPTLDLLQIQGLGEPMIHPRFFDMVRHAHERGIRVTTNTNMTLMTPERAQATLDSGLDTLHTSIDAVTPATYEAIRVYANYERVRRNLEGFLKARARAGTARPRVHLVMVIMRQNLDELPLVVRQAAAWGIDEMFVQQLSHEFGEAELPDQYAPMRDFVRGETLLHEDLARVTGVFDQAREIAAAAGLPLRLPRTRPRLHPPGTPGRERCDWPWTGAYVTYDGYLLPCCMVATPDRANLGNLADGTFEELWHGAAYRDFRARLDSDEPPDVCKSCSLYHGVF